MPDQRNGSGFQRLKSQADQERSRDSDRDAEPGHALQEGCEGEADDEQLQDVIFGEMGDRGPDAADGADLVRDLVQQQRGPDDV